MTPVKSWVTTVLPELMSTCAGCCGFEGNRPTDSKAVQTAGTIQLDLPTHTFELLNESSDFLEHALLFGQVLRIKRAHLGQNGIELGAIVTGEFAF